MKRVRGRTEGVLRPINKRNELEQVFRLGGPFERRRGARKEGAGQRRDKPSGHAKNPVSNARLRLLRSRRGTLTTREMEDAATHQGFQRVSIKKLRLISSLCGNMNSRCAEWSRLNPESATS